MWSGLNKREHWSSKYMESVKLQGYKCVHFGSHFHLLWCKLKWQQLHRRLNNKTFFNKIKKENVFGAIDHCYFSCHSWYYGKVPATHSHCTGVPLLAVGHFHWRKKLFVSPSTVSRIGGKYCTQEQLDRSVKVHQPSTKTQICSFVQGGAGGALPQPYKILQ